MDNDTELTDRSPYRALSALEKEEVKIRSLTVKRWLVTAEAAQYLSTTVDGIKALRRRGKIVPKKPFGRRNVYDRLELDRQIEATGQRTPLSNSRSKRWR